MYQVSKAFERCAHVCDFPVYSPNHSVPFKDLTELTINSKDHKVLINAAVEKILATRLMFDYVVTVHDANKKSGIFNYYDDHIEHIAKKLSARTNAIYDPEKLTDRVFNLNGKRVLMISAAFDHNFENIGKELRSTFPDIQLFGLCLTGTDAQENNNGNSSAKISGKEETAKNASLATGDIVKLLQIKSIGKSTVLKIHDLLSSEPGCEEINDAFLHDFLLKHSEILNIQEISSGDIMRGINKGNEIIEANEKSGIKMISHFDQLYPNSLRSLASPPLIINAIGNIEVLNRPSITILAAKRPSNFALSISEKIGYYLGKNNVNVVCGLDSEYDMFVLLGCRKSHGMVVAVITEGIERVHLKNETSVQEVLDNNGCLISEFMLNARNISNVFTNKAKVQLGISDAAIVIETDIDDEVMRVVRNSQEYNVKLAAFVHPDKKLTNKSRGNQILLSNGEASSISTTGDLDKLILAIDPTYTIKQDNADIPIEDICLA
jgi:DNA processing protein